MANDPAGELPIPEEIGSLVMNREAEIWLWQINGYISAGDDERLKKYMSCLIQAMLKRQTIDAE